MRQSTLGILAQHHAERFISSAGGLGNGGEKFVGMSDRASAARAIDLPLPLFWWVPAVLYNDREIVMTHHVGADDIDQVKGASSFASIWRAVEGVT